MLNLADIRKVFLIGIGGIGMSALARYFKLMGKEVNGYDKTQTALVTQLIREGINIHFEDSVDLIPTDTDLVIYTPAIPAQHAQFQYFKDNGYSLYKRSQILGFLSNEYKVLAVAGTHGKTTTSSLLTHLLLSGGIDCTAFLGGISESLGSNFVFGKSPWMVVEADEYDRSFLTLHPEHSVITSADPDHLDIYGNEAEMLKTFVQFASQNSKNGQVFIKEGLAITQDVKALHTNVQTYGIGAGEIYASEITIKEGYFHFDYCNNGTSYHDLKISLPGRHNIENAVAAISVASLLGVTEADIRHALVSFKGIKRRFEFIHRGRVSYIDDYAHHPGELAAAIQAARELYPEARITGIFQPHLYTRTRDFADGFAAVLDTLDEIWLIDIYPARELPIEGVDSKMLLEKMQNPNARLMSRNQILEATSSLEQGLLMTLGAGDIDTLVKPISEILKEKQHEN